MGDSRSLSRRSEERLQRTAVAHPGFPTAVQALQALHQELDIANPAGRKFHIEIAAAALAHQFLVNALTRNRDSFDC